MWNSTQQGWPDISIIVPAHNASQTIRECLESIFAISNAKVETIVVDDGSSDDTCMRASSIKPPKNHTVTIISTSNQGVSSARNHGLRLAKGSVIAFVDSDDTIQASPFVALCSQLHNSDCDVAIGGVRIHFSQSVTDYRVIPDSLANLTLPGEDAINALHRSGAFTPLVFAYVWKKQFVCDHQFQFEFRISEDDLWTTAAICLAKKVLCTNILHYDYIKRPQSLTSCNKNSYLRMFCHYSVSLKLYKFISSHNFCNETAGWISCKILYLVCDTLNTAQKLSVTQSISLKMCHMAKSFILKSGNMQIRRIGFGYLLRIECFLKHGVAIPDGEG